MVFLFTFLDDVVWYAAVYIYVYQFYISFQSQKWHYANIKRDILWVGDVSAWAIFIKRRSTYIYMQN